ncbi:hypothetical protein, partial [Persephonella sp. IF05-L8]|uniref:hypothetical protein n=1 Tax=Persephonella sp. IF05-L8 TaxID=1158338 RepID=UPI000496076F
MKIQNFEIKLNKEFFKSINLSRDFYQNFSLKNYVLTPLVQQILEDILDAINIPKSNRAWNVVGPYGSGKSAFMLFLSNLLSKINNYAHEDAENLLNTNAPELYEKYKSIGSTYANFLPILVTGSRISLEKALQIGIRESLEKLNLYDLLKRHQDILHKEEIDSNEIKEVLFSIHRDIQKFGYDGILLTIDEFGKILEYVALNIEEHDIFLLQDLAEYASRSEDNPFLLFTVLHQAFDQYVKFIGKTHQEEWEKIYGRFVEITFKGNPDQILFLIAKSINSNIDIPQTKQLIELAEKFPPPTIDSKTFKELANKVLPLHPATFEILPLLFFKYAQNERTVFSFLSSLEPNSFSKFVESLKDKLDFYYIFDLYSYVEMTLSNSILQNQKGRETWLLMEEALNRLENPTLPEIDVLKTIGILNLIGSYGTIKSSKEFIEYALYPKYTSKETNITLKILEDKKIITYRSYNNQYVLWSGSDINIEDEVAKAKKYIHLENIQTYLNKFYKLTPIIAKKFYHQSGNLKIFLREFLEDIKSIKLNEYTDGKVIYLLPKNVDDIKNLEREIKKIKKEELIFVVPKELPQLLNLIKELEAHYEVLQKINEIKDKIAKKEIEIRINQLSDILLKEIENVFNLKNCNVYHKGKLINIKNERQLNEYISEVCKKKFRYIPTMKNELINRRKISPSVKTAFRNLIKAIIENYHIENLGITGYPPEYAIYISLIKDKGLHEKVGNHYEFTYPKEKSLKKTWEYIENFIKSSIERRKSFLEVFEILEKAPFGLTHPVISIYLLVGLIKYDSEIAIFENGRFIPILTPILYERIIKNPSNFELQKYEITDFKKEFFERLAKTILNSKPSNLKGNKQQLLDIVKPIILFIDSLPNYTKQAKNLSEYSLKLRDAILNAEDPYKLIFEDIPKALNIKLNEDKIKNEVLEEFFKKLIESFKELKYHYDDLLNHIERILHRGFSISKEGEEGRKELIKKLEFVEDLVPENDELKVFINRVKDENLPYKEWLESIAITVHKEKSPQDWKDDDIRLFDLRIMQIAKKVKELEPIAWELNKNSLKTKGDKIPVKISILIP